MSGNRNEGGTSASVEVEFFSAEESAPRRTRQLLLTVTSSTSDLRAKLASLHAENLIIGRPTLYRVGSAFMDLSRGALPLASLLTDGHQLRCRYVVETWPQLLVQEAGGPSSFVVPFALAQTVAQLKTALQFISGINKQHMLCASLLGTLY